MSPIDRRKSTVPRLTITEILEKMQQMADASHQGDLQNNVLTVYNQLSLDDKRTFLRKSLMALWESQIDLATKGMQDVVVDQNLRISPEAVETERKTIETVNYEEQVKLKTWMHQVAFVLGIGSFIAVIGITFVVGGNGASVSELTKTLGEITKLLLGIK